MVPVTPPRPRLSLPPSAPFVPFPMLVPTVELGPVSGEQDVPSPSKTTSPVHRERIAGPNAEGINLELVNLATVCMESMKEKEQASVRSSTENKDNDQSFLRWSQTAVSIFSEAPEAPVAPPATIAALLHPKGILDKSFPRMSRTSASFSDSASTAPPKSMSTTSEGPDREEEILHSTAKPPSSTGTFGTRPPRSTTGITSAGSGPAKKGQAVSFKEAKPVDESYWEDDEDDSRSASSGRRRRPLSLSSASNTALSGSAANRPIRAKTTPGHYAFGTQKRPFHRSAETAQVTPNHLPKASSVNPVHANPLRLPVPSTLSPAHQIAPPNSSTPDKGQNAKDERMYGDSSESVFPPVISNDRPARTTGKLDQLLDEGAETARVLMELQRRAIGDSVELKPTNS